MSATTAMIGSEAKLLARNPGVVIWTVILPVAASIIIASIPAARQPLDEFGGLSVFQVYQPILVLFVVALLASRRYRTYSRDTERWAFSSDYALLRHLRVSCWSRSSC